MGALEPVQDNLVLVVDGEIGGVVQHVVNARELHAFLKSKQDFSTWIKRRIKEYDFIENVEFLKLHQKMELSKTGQIGVEYILSLDMAKELSMVERNMQGKKARRYFIQCEKILRQQNNSLMMQFYGALSEFQKASDLASQAGRTLNYAGKQLKPLFKAKVDILNQKIQPMLGFTEFENEKAPSILADNGASSTQTTKKGADV